MSDFQIIVRPLDKGSGDKMRTNIVRFLLAQIVAGMKPKLDLISWINAGWVELEDFSTALNGGGQHPALAAWEVDKGTAGRPTPSVRELYARRVVALMCTALERAGLNKKAARQFAAAKLVWQFVPVSDAGLDDFAGNEALDVRSPLAEILRSIADRIQL
jgi:hypothetical protein